MKKLFGTRSSDGRQAWLYTITDGVITAEVSDQGAVLVKLLVPDAKGNVADVVLGFDHPDGYFQAGYYGAPVGRNANRVGGAKFTLNGKVYNLDANDNGVNNLHSGFSPFNHRLWEVVSHTADSIKLRLDSPDGDQGFPGNATIYVTYTVKDRSLILTYDATCDQDTVFNMTNHSYFNLAGHDHPEKAMDMVLQMNATFFTVADELSIPTGELRPVEGSPMDFRTPKAIGRDLGEDYDAFRLQGGYDHNFEAKGEVCAMVQDVESGRTMEVLTDLPGIQFYCGNYMDGAVGKGGAVYSYRGAIALETQYYPDSINRPEWAQPFTKAGQPYHTETVYRFK